MDYIAVETKTWEQNQENLFDYESSSYKKNMITSNTDMIEVYGQSQANNSLLFQGINNNEPLFTIMKKKSFI